MSRPGSEPRFRVGICGGGIAGLCIAIGLSKYPDIKVSLYEAASSFKEIGAGVMIWGRAWRALSLLGLDDVLREVAGAPTDGSGDPRFGFEYRRSDQGSQGRLIHDLVLPYPGHLYHRAHFLLAIADRLPEGIAHLGRRIVSYSQRVADRTVEAKFEDGSTEIFDVFLGCDGIKSMVRQRLCEDYAKEGRPEMLKCVEPVWTGEVLYRNLIPSEKLPVRNGRPHPVLTKSIMYCGHNKHFFGYAIGRGKWANVGAFVTMPERRRTHWDGPWVSEASTQEVLDNFVGWESDLLEVIQCMEKPMRWAVHQVAPLPTYVKGSVALVGDAAHAMTTHQASGAEQAIEDAYMLSALLGHPSVTRANLQEALKAYEHVRLPFSQTVMNNSAACGELYEMRSKDSDNDPSWISTLCELWQWAGDEDLELQFQRALRWMSGAEDGSARSRM